MIPRTMILKEAEPMDKHESLNTFIMRVLIGSLQQANYPNRNKSQHRKGIRITITILSILYSELVQLKLNAKPTTQYEMCD